MRKIALFFGSFNPIHIGHLILANYIVENSDLRELWFVVTPQNPLKKKSTLLHDYDRLDMVELAINNYPKMRTSNIEFSMPKPSYTIDTLTYLKELYPDYSFSIIMGEDNLDNLHKWKNKDLLISNHQIIVYPRNKKDEDSSIQHENIHRIDAPIIEISSSKIREMIRDKKNVRPMLPPEVFNYIDKMGLYS